MNDRNENISKANALKALIDEIFFDYCKVVLGNKLFTEVDKLRNSQSTQELVDSFSLVESQINQRKELIKLAYSAKEPSLDSSDPCIIELKAKLFDMLMSIRECNKVDQAIKSNAVDQLKDENNSLKKKITKLDSNVEILQKSNDILKSTNKNLEEKVEDLQRAIRRMKPFGTSIEDYIRF